MKRFDNIILKKTVHVNYDSFQMLTTSIRKSSLNQYLLFFSSPLEVISGQICQMRQFQIHIYSYGDLIYHDPRLASEIIIF